MGDNLNPMKLYAINEETGQEIELGTVLENPEVEDCENYFEMPVIENYEGELEVEIKRISKKRFIKLLMARKIQKRDAEKIHNMFMEKYKHRTEIGLNLFVDFLLV